MDALAVIVGWGLFWLVASTGKPHLLYAFVGAALVAGLIF